MNKFSVWYVFLCCLFLSFTASAQTYIVEPNTTQLKELGRITRYYADTSLQLTIEDIRKKPDKEFKKSTEEIINLGETKARAWFKTNIENKSKEPLFLITQYPNLHYYECYAVQESGKIITSKFGGISQPFGLRKVNSSIPIFPLGDSVHTVFLSAKSINSLIVPIQIGTFESISNRVHREDIICGIIFGIMVVMAFFNLFFFFRVGETMYLYYSLYVLFSCSVLMEFTGYLYEMLWRFFNIETGDFYFVNIATSIFGALFAINFLKTKQKAPKLHYILICLVVFSICFNPILFPNLSRTFHRNILLTFTFMSIYGVAWYIYLKGYKPARFFVVAWTVYLTGIILAVCAEGGLLSFENWFTYYGYQLGACFEAILLSLALPDRMIYYQKLSEEAEENRQQLSRDLHDDMGATLTSISHLGNAAIKTIALKPNEPQLLKPLLEQIIGAGKQATESMRGILWALSPENEETDAFFNKLISHFSDMLKAGSLVGDFMIHDEINTLKLSAFQRRNLFMFLKESLQNILKHAKAQRADIHFYYNHSKLKIEVNDNGIGFNQGSKFDGYGLKTMKYRAEELGGKLTIESSESNGTQLVLEIPIKK